MAWTNESFQKYRLMAPGPVPLHPDVMKTLSREMIHHRTPLFDQILKNTLQNLKKIFQTSENVYILSGTGSSGMEAALVNVLSPGDQILCINSGKFGERWAEMGKVFGYHVHTLKVEWGEAVKPSLVFDFLKNNPRIRAVLCQACETSTAVLHPIQELGKIIEAFSDTLFIVDGITAVGALELPMDEWKIDALVAGSQKAFMLPTGLSFVAFSKKAEAQFEAAKTPRYYLDVRLEKKANEKGETFFSSSVTLIRALDCALQLMLTTGLPTWLAKIKSRSEFTQKVLQKLGLEIYSKSPSPSLTAVQVPSSVDGQKWRLLLEEEYNLTVMGGQDQLKGKVLRIGHMGHITHEDLMAMSGAFFKSLQDLKIPVAINEIDFYKYCQKELGL